MAKQERKLKKSNKAVEPLNFVPGWIGGRLTSPACRNEATMKTLRDRIAVASKAKAAETSIFAPAR